jgi:hypothetical protein
MSARSVCVVVYRTGGTANFQWKRSLSCLTRAGAQTAAELITRGGRPAFVVDYALSLALGLPETYDATSAITESR